MRRSMLYGHTDRPNTIHSMLITEKGVFFHAAGFGIFGRHKILCEYWAPTPAHPRPQHAGDGAPPPGPQQGEALALQAAGYQAILHGNAGGYR